LLLGAIKLYINLCVIINLKLYIMKKVKTATAKNESINLQKLNELNSVEQRAYVKELINSNSIKEVETALFNTDDVELQLVGLDLLQQVVFEIEAKKSGATIRANKARVHGFSQVLAEAYNTQGFVSWANWLKAEQAKNGVKESPSPQTLAKHFNTSIKSSLAKGYPLVKDFTKAFITDYKKGVYDSYFSGLAEYIDKNATSTKAEDVAEARMNFAREEKLFDKEMIVVYLKEQNFNKPNYLAIEKWDNANLCYDTNEYSRVVSFKLIGAQNFVKMYLEVRDLIQEDNGQ
jgi:hypothetical protein